MVTIRVFVSSRLDELKEERALIKSILPKDDYNVFLFEDVGARTESTRRVYLEEVSNCDIYIGVFKQKYSKPTEEEYRAAKNQNKHILIYIDAAVSNRDPELERLIVEINENHTRSKFHNLVDLESKVKKDVNELLKRKFKQPTITIDEYLLKYNLRIINSRTKFTPGNKNCWKFGVFHESDIHDDFDARRPITNKVLQHTKDNSGTFLYGRPHFGKSLLLKRIMIEEMKRNKTIVVVEAFENKASVLKQLLINLILENQNILVVVDEAHKSGVQEIFKVYNDLSSEELEKIHFVFAARQEDFNNLRNILTFDENKEIEKAMSKVVSLEVGFDLIDAYVMLKKGFEVSTNNKKNDEDIKRLSQYLYKFSHGNPFMFVYAMIYYISENKVEAADFNTNFILMDIQAMRNLLKDKNEARLSILCSFLHIFGINISNENVNKFRFISSDLKLLSNKNFIFKNFVYKTKHELWAAEYVNYILEREYDNDFKSFDLVYGINELFQTIINNSNLNNLYNIIDVLIIFNSKNKYQKLFANFLEIIKSSKYEQLDDKELTNFYCFGIGTYYLLTKDYQNALVYYDKTLKLDPNHEVLNNKGFVYVILKQYDKAIDCFDRALETRPKDKMILNNKLTSLYFLKRNDDLLKQSNEAIEIDPNYEDFWNNKGLALYNLQRYQESIECFDKAIMLNPNKKFFNNNKGLALYNLQRYQESIECFDKEIELNPNYADPWFNKANSLQNLEKLNEALAFFNQAIKINPNYADAWLNKGTLLHHNFESFEEALQCFEKAIEINPTDWMYWFAKGQVLSAINDKKEIFSMEILEQILYCYNQATKFNPNEPFILLNKGALLHEMKNFEEALKCYDHAIQLNPNFEIAWFNKGMLHQELKEYDKALFSYNESLKLKNNDITVLYKRATTKLKIGDTKGCIDDLTTAIKLDKKAVTDSLLEDPDFDGFRRTNEFKKLIN